MEQKNVDVVLQELVEQGGANVYVQCGETNKVRTTIIQEDNKMQNLLDKTKAEMNSWGEKRKSMPTIPRLGKCKEQLEQTNHLILMGISGEGKTTLAMELLRLSGREPIILREPEQWEDIDVENGEPKVVLIDDIFGRFSLNSATKAAWLKKVGNMYATVQGGKVQIVVTCREHIFMSCDAELKNYDLFKKSNVHLSRADSSYCLEPADKLKILLSNSKIVHSISEQDCRQIANMMYTSVGFAQCCHVFVSDFKYIDRGVDFFRRPFEVIEEVLNQMSKSPIEEAKFEYCVLGCVLIFDGLSRECIEQIDNNKTGEFCLVTEIAKACRIQTHTLFSAEIRNAADRLSTSYLTFENGKYSFQHNSMLEAVFKSFFESKAKILLQCCDWELLRDLVSSQGSKNNLVSSQTSVVCIVPMRHYEDLSRRLVGELTCYRPDNFSDYWRVVSVLGHRVFSDQDVVEAFFSCMTENEKNSLFCTVYSYGSINSSILNLSAVWSPHCLYKRLMSELGCLWGTEKFGETGKALWGVCDYGDYSRYMTPDIGITAETPDIGITADRDDQLWRDVYGDSSEIMADLSQNYPYTRNELHRHLVYACKSGEFKLYRCILEHCDKTKVTNIINKNVLEWTSWAARERSENRGVRDIVAHLESKNLKIPKCKYKHSHEGRSFNLFDYTFTYQ